MFPIPNRRSFLTRSAMGLGGIALAELLHAADAKKPNRSPGSSTSLPCVEGQAQNRLGHAADLLN